MQENKPVKEEYEPADVICADCTGEQLQLKVDRKTLFSFKYYVRWKFQCNKCGKQSKEHISKISDVVQQNQ